MTRSPERRFAFRLAAWLGVWNVYGMLNEMSYRQFLDWQNFYALEPFGEYRADVRAAQLAQMAHNVAVDKRHQKKSLNDFLLKWEEYAKPKEPPTPERINSIFMILAQAQAAGAKDL